MAQDRYGSSYYVRGQLKNEIFVFFCAFSVLTSCGEIGLTSVSTFNIVRCSRLDLGLGSEIEGLEGGLDNFTKIMKMFLVF